MWTLGRWGHMVELSEIGVGICTCFRERVSLDCYWKGECGEFSRKAIKVKIRGYWFMNYMGFLYLGWLVFFSPGFSCYYLHSLCLSSSKLVL